MSEIKLFTIGFTQKSAERFFGLLKENHIDVLVDIRLKPHSQLSGFAKARDLPYFVKELSGCDYRHMLNMAPTADILTRYRKDKSWADYVVAFNQLIVERNLIAELDRSWWQANRTCLLCSEHEPDECHRQLVVDYLQSHWTEISVQHLM